MQEREVLEKKEDGNERGFASKERMEKKEKRKKKREKKMKKLIRFR
jgi:hypothetical protein